MPKESKLFDRFYRRKYTLEKGEAFSLLEELKQKAIRFIKARQLHSSSEVSLNISDEVLGKLTFREILSLEQGGDIEVSISQLKDRENEFHVKLRFVTMNGATVFSEEKLIDYQDLVHLASQYDKNKELIDDELTYREEARKKVAFPR